MAQGIEIVELPEILVSSTTNVIVQNPEGVGKATLKNLRDTVGVSIDTVNASAITGLPGTEVIAKVKQTGTDQNKQFDFEFTIPKGDKGDKGGQFTEDEIKSIKVNNSVNSDQLGNIAAENYAKKSDIVNVYKYKGSVATKEDLPKENNVTGDVYDVQDTGMNFAWDGTKWDALGNKFDLDSLTKTIILASQPVGTYYWTSDANFNPNVAWGGTWERVQDKILVAKGSKYTKNIDASDLDGNGELKLTVAQLPSHNHGMTHNHPMPHTHNMEHRHDRGDMNITGTFWARGITDSSAAVISDQGGAFSIGRIATGKGVQAAPYNDDGHFFNFDGNKTWSGRTSNTLNKNSPYASKTNTDNPSITNTSNSTKTVTDNRGDDNPIKPLPPIECAYCWKRTA